MDNNDEKPGEESSLVISRSSQAVDMELQRLAHGSGYEYESTTPNTNYRRQDNSRIYDGYDITNTSQQTVTKTNEDGENYDTISESGSDNGTGGDPDRNDSIPKQDIIELVICILAFVGRGLCLNSVGPTLIDLRQIAKMSIPQSSVIFVCQSLGFLIGSIAAKPLLQRFNNLIVLSICLFTQAGSTSLIPAFPDKVMMSLMFVGQGFAIGVVGIGVCAACIRLGSKTRNGMFLQAVYFGVSMGSVLGPFVAKPFLSKKAQHTDNHDLASEQLSAFQTIVSNRPTYEVSTSFNVSLENITTMISTPLDEQFTKTRVHLFYIIMGVILCVPAVCFLLLFFCRDRTKSYTKQADTKSAESLAFHLCSVPLVTAITLVFLQCLLYFGTQDTYSNLLTSFAVLGPLKLNKPIGVYLTSLFWASMAFGRLNGIWIAKLVAPFTILIVDFTMASIASFFLLVLAGKYNGALWFFTFLLGISFSTVNGATVSWSAKHLPSNNYILSLIMIGRCFGLLIIPTTVNFMFKSDGAMVLMRALFATVLGMLVTVIASHILANKFGVNGKLTTIKKSDETQDKD